jgi:hypothetical protein
MTIGKLEAITRLHVHYLSEVPIIHVDTVRARKMRVVVTSSVTTPQNACQGPHIGIERADKIGCRNHTLQLGHKLKCLMIATLVCLFLVLFALAMAFLVALRQGVQIAANRYLVGKNLANLHDGSIVIGSHKTMFKGYIGGYLLELVNVRSSIVFWGFSIELVASSNTCGLDMSRPSSGDQVLSTECLDRYLEIRFFGSQTMSRPPFERQIYYTDQSCLLMCPLIILALKSPKLRRFSEFSPVFGHLQVMGGPVC